MVPVYHCPYEERVLVLLCVLGSQLETASISDFVAKIYQWKWHRTADQCVQHWHDQLNINLSIRPSWFLHKDFSLSLSASLSLSLSVCVLCVCVWEHTWLLSVIKFSVVYPLWMPGYMVHVCMHACAHACTFLHVFFSLYTVCSNLSTNTAYCSYAENVSLFLLLFAMVIS